MAAAQYDLIIRNGTLIDGSGAAPRRADLAVSGDRIATIGPLDGAAATEEVDATGMAVAPGFIDVHTHDDHALLAKPDMRFKASQGVTTVICGNCGVSLAPLAFAGERAPAPLDLLGDGYRFPRMADFVAALEAEPPAINAGLLCGHSTLRVGAMDALDRPARPAEIAAMREALAEALEAGALGLSSGLAYSAANAAPTEEIVALAELLGPAGALYTTHLRDEGPQIEAAMEEAFRIGTASGAAVVLSHHKVSGMPSFGKTATTLALVERMRAEHKVDLDVYPYTASSTVIRPERVLEAARTVITWSVAMPEAAGRDLAEIAAELGCSPIEAADRLQPGGAIYFAMDEADVQRVLRYPHSMIGSDGLPHDTFPHPRLWGTFPRVLGHYCRELGLMPLEEAVHRMTGKSAAVFGLARRGILAEGNFADVTIFDPLRVADRADFENPTAPAEGILQVIVNGTTIWRDGASTGRFPGRVLKRQEQQALAA